MTNGIALLALVTVVTTIPAIASGQGSDEDREDETASSAMDDRLFRDLGGLQPQRAAAAPLAPAGRSPTGITSNDPVGQASQADAWTVIGQQMRQVQSRLRQADHGPDTLRIQQQIVEKLEQLLLQTANRSGQSAAKGGEASEQGPSELSGDRASSGQTLQADQGVEQGATNLRRSASDTPRKLLEQAWGHLPTKLRQQLQSVGQEQFLPQYAPQIEAYYRSLSTSGPATP